MFPTRCTSPSLKRPQRRVNRVRSLQDAVASTVIAMDRQWEHSAHSSSKANNSRFPHLSSVVEFGASARS